MVFYFFLHCAFLLPFINKYHFLTFSLIINILKSCLNFCHIFFSVFPPKIFQTFFPSIYFPVFIFLSLRSSLLFALRSFLLVHLSFLSLNQFRFSLLSCLFLPPPFSFRNSFSMSVPHLFHVHSYLYRVIWNNWRLCQTRLQFRNSAPQHESPCLIQLFCRQLAAS